MDEKIVIEVVDRLIGGIDPSGEDYIDQDILKNVDTYGKVVNYMITRLGDVYLNNKNSPYTSEKKIVDSVRNILSTISSDINNIINNP